MYTKARIVSCEKCGNKFKFYWLKDGLCNGCQNPDLIVTAKVDKTDKEECLHDDVVENGICCCGKQIDLYWRAR